MSGGKTVSVSVDEKKVIKCRLCGSKFTPEVDQLDAHWAVTWCSGASGKLCPPCHSVAKRLRAVAKTAPPLGVLPWGSDIVKKSKTTSKKDWERRRRNESWRTWVENNRPEWL